MRLTRAAVPYLKQRGSGRIINIGSTSSAFAEAEHASYCASKHAIEGLTKAMAVALADHHVRVNAVGPGSIMTDILKVVMDSDEARRRILSRTPLGRAGEPDEVARLVLFLASDEASYINGAVIEVSGGMTV